MADEVWRNGPEAAVRP